MTIYLDRRFREVGRIKKAAGTAHKPTIRRLNDMLTSLDAVGRYDLLRAIKRGDFSLLQVYEHFRTNDLSRLPTADMLLPLGTTMGLWLEDYECSDRHRESLRQSCRYLTAGYPDTSLAGLPERLEAIRTTMKRAGKARSFNLARSAAQAFIRSTLKRQHRLWLEVSSVEPLKEVPKGSRRPMTPLEVDDLCDALSPDASWALYTMCRTGMGPTEYWENGWDDRRDRVHIFGTKREGRDRDVPRLFGILRPQVRGSYRPFREELADLTGGVVTPYDCRRTFAHWLELSGIPRSRRRQYLGHGAADVTDLYEAHDVDAYLAEDRLRLETYLVNAIRQEQSHG